MWNMYSVLNVASGVQVNIALSYESAIKDAILRHEASGKKDNFAVINHIPLFDTSDPRDMASRGK